MNKITNIGIDEMKEAARRAFRGHGWKREVREFKADFEGRCAAMLDALLDGTWTGRIRYRSFDTVNNDGKRRRIDSPSLETLIYQHLALCLLEPAYQKRDNLNGLNCKPGCGITARDKRRSVIHRVKRLFYDRLDLEYALVIDQRKCYGHVTPEACRRALKGLTDDRWLIDFATGVSFHEGRLPIGTPTSPFIHHAVTLRFDLWVKGICPFSVRYADDNLLAFHTREEAQAAKWRVKNFWWYELGMRAKRHTARVRPLDLPLDFCGYVFHRNGRGKAEHDKGYVTVRRATADRARRCRGEEGWASYFGLMRHADAFSLMRKIENDMKLRKLTETVRIDRDMDARHVEVKDLVDVPITVYKYEIRYNSQKEPNWVKCLVGIEEVGADGSPTGKTLAREFHGNYQGIIRFLLAAERAFGKDAILPLEEVEIENQCGYIFKGSTNQLKYIEDENS